jgi:rod shape determining protein RodA
MDRRVLLGFDWIWLLTLLALSGAGIAAIWSTTEGTSLDSYFGKQVIYLCFALVVFFVLLYFDYHVFSDFIPFIYAGGMILLGLVLVIGVSSHGNKSWISLGFFSFQPSELMKIIVIIALAKYYSRSEGQYLGLKELCMGGLIVFVPMGMVILQKDLGTAVTYLPIYGVLSLLTGIRRKHLLALILMVAVAAPFGWLGLRDYQQERIRNVFNPSNDPQGMGYQSRQSEIAIGSGRLFGKGFKQGSQGNLGFLPAQHTDFVFAVLAEEMGFAGSLTVLGLFFLLLSRVYRAARDAKDKTGTYIVAGVLTLLLFHLTINIGMVVALLPIAGIPLPFVSAGGSALVTYYAAMSLCMGIWMRRYVN